MRPWLARLGFSFVVLAFVLFWSAYQRTKTEGTSARVVLYTLLGAACAAAGLAGVRERHRPGDDQRPDDPRSP